MAEVGAETVRDWVVEAARTAEDKGGSDVVVLEVGDILAITDWFVIVDGASDRQVRTIVDAVEERVREVGGPSPRRVEGRDALTWVLVDYGDFVVHVFAEDARRFYELERLWADVPRLDWSREARRSS